MKYYKSLLVVFSLILLNIGTVGIAAAANSETQTCSDGSVVTLDSACPQSSDTQGTTATNSTFKSDACKGLNQLDSSQSCNSGGSGVASAAATAATIISLLVGIVAIIMIVVAGLKYITSGGEAAKVSSAKSTLIYALIGIAIAGVAQFLVHFVLNNAVNSVNTTTSQSSSTSSQSGSSG